MPHPPSDWVGLRKLSDAAFEVDTLAEFEATLAQLQTQAEDSPSHDET
jgi:hypothetical protein